MKVAFVTHSISPVDENGASKSSRLIVNGLRGLGVDVDVYTFFENDSFCDRFYRLSETRSNLPDPLGRLYDSFSNAPSFDEYDVVHCYGPMLLPGVVRNSNVPVVGTFNSYIWAYMRPIQYLKDGCSEFGKMRSLKYIWDGDYAYSKKIPRWILFELGKYYSKKADYFTVQNNGMKEILEKCGYDSQRIDTVPNLYNPEFKSPKTSREKRIIFAGRLVDKKGPLDLVKAFSELPREYTDDWNLDIYGKGKQENQIKKYCDRYENINLNYASHDKLSEIYRKAGFMVHSSKYVEPFSRTWLEALQTKTPILCSENPSSKAVLEEISEFYNPFDQNELKEKITKMMEDKEKRNKMERKMEKEGLKHYKPVEVAEKYLKTYQRIN